ncbi:MAG: glutamate racemase [Cardiobacteriaceae bacterium]|nr:glutamate racemase [Cardiobacteriaceae bacterium]
MLQEKKAIGVFDSGVGGLTVVRALRERLPRENIVYFGDTARVPYGTKSRNTIEQFSAQIVEFLLEQQVKILVIACNTIAAVAGTKIRQMAGKMPVIDVIGAGAEAAIQASTTGKIGVIATSTTVNSKAYPKAIEERKYLWQDKFSVCRVFSEACSVLVPLIEEGWLDNEVTRLALREYLPPLLNEKIDTLILGCTHYPLIKPLLSEEAKGINLVDSSTTTAEAVYQVLKAENLLNNQEEKPDYRFFVSDIPLRFRAIGEQFLQFPLEQLEMISL